MRLAKLLLLFAAIHLVVALGCVAFGYALSMSTFDSSQPEPVIDTIANVLFSVGSILLLPGSLGWAGWGRDLPKAVEWLILLTNSLLWGAFIAEITSKIARRRRAV